jgi:hypothetical protein
LATKLKGDVNIVNEGKFLPHFIMEISKSLLCIMIAMPLISSKITPAWGDSGSDVLSSLTQAARAALERKAITKTETEWRHELDAIEQRGRSGQQQEAIQEQLQEIRLMILILEQMRTPATRPTPAPSAAQKSPAVNPARKATVPATRPTPSPVETEPPSEQTLMNKTRARSDEYERALAELRSIPTGEEIIKAARIQPRVYNRPVAKVIPTGIR